MRVSAFLFTAAAAILLAGAAGARSGAGLHWATLHVYHTEPTEVFAKLGLTHSTRYGHTLGQKHVPDPSFPPGLTDVVPYDAGHTLLVRGTSAGLAQFRARVASADVPDPQWQVSVTLLHSASNGGSAQVIAGQSATARADHPVTFSFDAAGQMPRYEITVHLNPDGTLSVTRRTSLALAPAPASPAPDSPQAPVMPPPTATTPPAPGPPAASAPAVFVPAAVWTPPVREDVRLGDMLSFPDLAADRAAARKALGQPDAGTGDDADYTVQIQVNPSLADAVPSAAATP